MVLTDILSVGVDHGSTERTTTIGIKKTKTDNQQIY